MNATRLLVSVRSAEEARAAIAGGADIIDVKEPMRGSLGAASAATVREVVRAVSGRCAVSVALGELREAPDVSWIPEGVSWAKVGLRESSPDWRDQLSALFTSVGVAPIAAAYARFHGDDPWPSVQDVLDWAVARPAAGILIDTCVKDGRSLRDSPDASGLPAIVDRAHRHGLLVALAGSLDVRALPWAMALRPDVIAVRGAACEGGRLGTVRGSCVQQLKAVIARGATPEGQRAGSPA